MALIPILHSLSFVQSTAPPEVAHSDILIRGLALRSIDVREPSNIVMHSLSAATADYTEPQRSDYLLKSMGLGHRQLIENLSVMLRAISAADERELHRDVTTQIAEFM